MIVEFTKKADPRKSDRPTITAVCYRSDPQVDHPLRRLQNIEIKMAPVWEPPLPLLSFFIEDYC